MAHLVFFVADRADDRIAAVVRERVRTMAADWPATGFFDDPDAHDPAERTTGGYVRIDDEAPSAARAVAALRAAAVGVARQLSVRVEVQWQEEVLGHIGPGGDQDEALASGLARLCRD